MIDISLQKSYGGFSLDVAFTSETHGITVLTGPSGSGKTSIINMIAGLTRPDSGHIDINGRRLYDADKGIDWSVQKRRCGYIFQDGRLFPHMDVRKNLLYGNRSEVSQLDEVVDLLGIGHLQQRMPGKLSGGEKQRVAIGRALLMQPEVLLMDEPLASLDAERKDELLPYIARLPQHFNLPIFYVTHSRREILRLSDALIRIDQGRILSSGQPEGGYFGLGTLESSGDHLSVFECQMTGYDEEYGVIKAIFPGGTIFILAAVKPQETKIRAAIKASDVSVSLQKPTQISTRNIFTARIVKLEDSAAHSILVHTNAGIPITACISRASAHRLELKVGQEVFLLVKAVSMTF